MMNDTDFKDKITLYIDGQLSDNEKKEFEETLRKNKKLSLLYSSIIENDLLIKEIPTIKTSVNFMNSLHKRIDDYNVKGSFSWQSMKDFIYNVKPVVGYSFASIALIISISIFKISDMSNLFYSSSDISTELSNYVAINESDSLNLDNDSLKNEILLLGNDR